MKGSDLQILNATLPLKIFFNVSEASDILGVSRSTLYRLWQSGDGPRRSRIGMTEHIARHHLIEFIMGTEVVADERGILNKVGNHVPPEDEFHENRIAVVPTPPGIREAYQGMGRKKQ